MRPVKFRVDQTAEMVRSDEPLPPPSNKISLRGPAIAQAFLYRGPIGLQGSLGGGTGAPGSAAVLGGNVPVSAAVLGGIVPGSAAVLGGNGRFSIRRFRRLPQIFLRLAAWQSQASPSVKASSVVYGVPTGRAPVSRSWCGRLARTVA